MCIHAKVKVFQFLGKFYSPPLWHLFMLFSSPYGSIQYSPCSVGKVEQHLESVDRACPRANIASDLSNVKATLSCCYFLVYSKRAVQNFSISDLQFRAIETSDEENCDMLVLLTGRVFLYLADYYREIRYSASLIFDVD
jgi:hypothetical protein